MTGMFLFLVRLDGQPIDPEFRSRLDAAVVNNDCPRVRWTLGASHAAGLEPDHSELGTGPFVAQTRQLLVIGNARLDNRREVASWTEAPERLAHEPDLQVIAAAIHEVGISCIPRILGDFAFVVYDQRTREITAARDAFGVKTLYYREWPEQFAFSSRAAILGDRDIYDRDYLIDYLVSAAPRHDRTAFQNVRALAPGSTLHATGSTARVQRFWSAYDFSIREGQALPDAVETFRTLLFHSVALRLTGSNDVWSDLSGGLDSSSVVSVAQRLRDRGDYREGLAGTITAVDTLGSGREGEYVAAVLDRYPTPNEEVRNYWMWQDDGLAPPRVDAPSPAYPFFARDRRMNHMVRTAGGHVLLSGEGPDHYLTGSLHFVADWLAQGRFVDAARELLRWATVLRTSAWRLTHRYAFAPIVAKRLHPSGLNPLTPAWLTITTSERRALADRLNESGHSGSASCSFYERPIAQALDDVALVAERPVISKCLEMRYPFLHRPLVEFSLRLPPQMRSQPHARKWIQREAMRGVLPDRVRMRAGKGGAAGRFAWSMRHESTRIQSMLRHSVLDDLGLVNPSILRRESTQVASTAVTAITSSLMTALTLETWLCVRSGGWVTATPTRSSTTRGEHFCSRPVVIS